MRRLITSLLLALLAPLAAAQATPPPPCWPKKIGAFVIPGGTGSEVQSDALQDVGIFWVWRCPDGSVAYRAVREDWKALNAWEIGGIIMNAPTVIEALELIWTSYGPRQAACTPEDPCDPSWLALAAEANVMGATIPIPDGTPQPEPDPDPPPDPPPLPPPGTWKVSGLAVFNTARGSLAGYVGGTAPKGALCDCAAPIIVGGKTYCTFAGAATAQLVAQCSKAP